MSDWEDSETCGPFLSAICGQKKLVVIWSCFDPCCICCAVRHVVTCSDMYTRLRGLHLGTNFEPTALLLSNRFFDRCFWLFFWFFFCLYCLHCLCCFCWFCRFCFWHDSHRLWLWRPRHFGGHLPGLSGHGQNGSKWINSKSQIQNCDVWRGLQFHPEVLVPSAGSSESLSPLSQCFPKMQAVCKAVQKRCTWGIHKRYVEDAWGCANLSIISYWILSTYARISTVHAWACTQLCHSSVAANIVRPYEALYDLYDCTFKRALCELLELTSDPQRDFLLQYGVTSCRLVATTTRISWSPLSFLIFPSCSRMERLIPN